MGQAVVQGLTAGSSLSKVTWTAVPASRFPGGISQLGIEVIDQRTWVAIASALPALIIFLIDLTLSQSLVNEGASNRLQTSYTTPNATYNGTEAITVYGNEARNENA